MTMTPNEYQDQALATAIYPGSGEILGLAYVGLGLGEAGEVQGKIKKIIRDCDGVITQEHKDAIAKELGDIQWYVAAAAKEIEYTLEEIMEGNIHKLTDRGNRGQLKGSGDDR